MMYQYKEQVKLIYGDIIQKEVANEWCGLALNEHE